MVSAWRRRDWIRYDPPNLLTGVLLGKDRIYSAAGQVPSYDLPNPQIARQPQENQGFIHGASIQLIGKDQFFASAGQAPVYDYPNPRRPVQPPQADSLCNFLVGLLARPFAMTEWPNPLLALQSQENRGFIRASAVYLIGKDQFFAGAGQAPVYDYPNPQRPRYPLQPEPPPNLLTTTFTIVVTPFNMLDWPNPLLPAFPQENKGYVRAASTQLFGKDTFFAGPGQAPVYDWPNPLRARYPIQADSQGNLLVGLLARPFFTTEWPLPQRALQPQENQSFIHSASTYLIGLDTFFAAPGQAPVYDWPLPQRPRYPVQPEPPPNLQTTTFTIVVAPFYLLDWPNPAQPRQPIENRGFVRSVSIQLFGKDQFFAAPGMAPTYDYPNPLTPRQPIENRGFIRSASTYLIGKDTFFAGPGQAPVYDYPNPQRRYPLQPEPPPDLLTTTLFVIPVTTILATISDSIQFSSIQENYATFVSVQYARLELLAVQSQPQFRR